MQCHLKNRRPLKSGSPLRNPPFRRTCHPFWPPSLPMAWRELGVLQAAREAPPCAAAPGVDFGGRENLPEVSRQPRGELITSPARTRAPTAATSMPLSYTVRARRRSRQSRSSCPRRDDRVHAHAGARAPSVLATTSMTSNSDDIPLLLTLLCRRLRALTIF